MSGEHLPESKSNCSTTAKVLTKTLIFDPKGNERLATLVLDFIHNDVEVMLIGLNLCWHLDEDFNGGKVKW